MTTQTQTNDKSIVRMATEKQLEAAYTLLDNYDWKSQGYDNMFVWFRELYGPDKTDADLLEEFTQGFVEAGYL